MKMLLNNILKEVLNKKKTYCGVLIEKESRDMLLSRFEDKIPDGWKKIAHHMTIDPFSRMKDLDKLGKNVKLKVTEFGISDKACAVKVEGYKGKTNNKFPHVTLAINDKEGAKPKDSNDIKKWEPLNNEFFIDGTIENL